MQNGQEPPQWFYVMRKGKVDAKKFHCKCSVVTLALSSQPRQGGCKVAGQEEGLGVTSHVPENAKSVREWTLTLPSELPSWELESKWNPEYLECDYRGQNTSVWKVLYIIENILKHKCLKWAFMTRLHIWNISYDKKKGHESN
jgi:hypothetical protein